MMEMVTPRSLDGLFGHNMQKMNKMIEALCYNEREFNKQAKAQALEYQMKKFVSVKNAKGNIIS